MNGLEWFIAALLAAAVVGIAAALIHSRIWPVDTGTHDFHRPLDDSPARRHTSRSEK